MGIKYILIANPFFFFFLAGGASTGVEVNRNLNSHRKSVDVHYVPRHLGLVCVSLSTRCYFSYCLNSPRKWTIVPYKVRWFPKWIVIGYLFNRGGRVLDKY